MHWQRVLPVAMPKLDMVSTYFGLSPAVDPRTWLILLLLFPAEQQRSILLRQGASDEETNHRSCPVGTEALRQDRRDQGI